jgi:lysophospholipase L1-like esterase
MSPSARRRWPRWYVAVGLAIFLIAALDQGIDLAFKRITAPVMEMIEFTDAPDAPYFHLRRNADVRYSGFAGPEAATHIHVNGLGLRDRERPIAKPPGVHRIVALGDSFTFGLGVEVEDAVPAQLERVFAANGRGDVEVWNVGTPGHSLADHLGTLEQTVLGLHPDVVLLQLFADDALQPFPVSPSLARCMHYSGLAKLYFALRMMRSQNAEAFTRSYAALVATCQRAGIPLVVWVAEYPPDTKEFIETYNRQHGIRMMTLEQRPIPRLDHDIHLSAAGNRECAQLLYDLTKDLV